MRSTAPGGGAASPPMRALRCVVRWNATSGRSKARTTADDPHRRAGSLPPNATSPVLVVLELHQRFEVERQRIDRVAHLAAGGLVGHADLDLVHLRTLHVAQSRRARVGVVHVRHQVADLLDVLDAVEALQQVDHRADGVVARSAEHTSELQSLMRISYAVFCLKKKKNIKDSS